MIRAPVLLALLLCLPACAGLIVHDTDTADTKAGKIAARTLIALPTLGMSELVMVDVKTRVQAEDQDRQIRERLAASVGHLSMDEAVSKLGPPSST